MHESRWQHHTRDRPAALALLCPLTQAAAQLLPCHSAPPGSAHGLLQFLRLFMQREHAICLLKGAHELEVGSWAEGIDSRCVKLCTKWGVPPQDSLCPTQFSLSSVVRLFIFFSLMLWQRQRNIWTEFMATAWHGLPHMAWSCPLSPNLHL